MINNFGLFFINLFYYLGLIVTKSNLISRMKEELLKIGVSEANFKGSNGWLDRFLKRFHLKTRRITGVGRILPENLSEIIWDHIDDMNDLIEDGMYISF